MSERTITTMGPPRRRRAGEGDAWSLAAWFQAPIFSHAADDEEMRLEVLSDALAFREFGVRGQAVILRTPRGRTVIERRREHKTDLVFFEHVPNHRSVRIRFFVNPSSVRFLSDRLRAAPEKRASFDAIFFDA